MGPYSFDTGYEDVDNTLNAGVQYGQEGLNQAQQYGNKAINWGQNQTSGNLAPIAMGAGGLGILGLGAGMLMKRRNAAIESARLADMARQQAMMQPSFMGSMGQMGGKALEFGKRNWMPIAGGVAGLYALNRLFGKKDKK